MSTQDDPSTRHLVTYRRSHTLEEEETVPDSEDSTPPTQSRPTDHDGGNPISSPIKAAESDPPRPPRAVYRSRKRAGSPPPLSYSSIAPAEEVIPDSEDNGPSVGTSDDDNEDIENKSPSNTRKHVSFGLSDWKQKLRDIDDQYDADQHTQSPHEIPSAVPDPKGASPEVPFTSPLTTEASSQHASHRQRADDSLSSPSRDVSSSTNTTPQFLLGTPQALSPTPPTSDGKPSPMPKARAKAKAKARAPSAAQEAATDDQLASSPDAIRQTKRSEKQKKSKAPTKKELLEARRETARMRSDMRVSISTDATRPLDIKTLPSRCHRNLPPPSAQPLQPQSSVSDIEPWSSSSPASAHDLVRPGAHQDEGAEMSQEDQHVSRRRSASPFRSTGLLAPMSKYKVASATDDDDDDPFRIVAPSSAPKKTSADRQANSGSGSDVEMPGIGEILAEKEARESQRMQKERLQQLKLAALAQQQQRRASTSTGVPRGAEHDSDDDDDELDVVQDTMHSVAREEAAARAVAGRTRPSIGRTTQLRLARVAASPQRNAAAPLLPAATESPEKRMAAAAQPTFLSSLAQGSGAAAGRGKRSAGMTKDELERMVLRSAEAQNEQLRKEKEEEWVRRGGRVVGVMEDLGEEKVQELIGEALERSEGTRTQGDGDDTAGSDEDEDGDYVPNERGSASPQHIKSQEAGHDEEGKMATDERSDNDDGIAEAAAAATEVDSEMESSIPDDVRMHRPRAARPRRAIIGSDDDDGPSAAPEHAGGEEEDTHLPPPLSLTSLPSPAFTATASPWPSGNAEPDHDQENDPDVSGNDTDKENRAVVVVGPPPTHGARVLFNDILSARAAGMKATVQPLPLLQSSGLLTDDDPFAFTPSPAKARDEVLRQLASPVSRQLADKRGLSQMFEEEENDSAPVPALVIQGGRDDDGGLPGSADPGLVGFKPVLGGLSHAFEETQDASGSGLGMGGLAALRRGADAEFSLTFEAQAVALQPALEVDDSLRARAAAIFEKEQEYVIEAAQLAPSRAPRRELYITENGFLTQTRPEGSSPLMYRPSPTQRPYDALLRSQSDGMLGVTALGAGTGTGTASSSPLVTRQPLSTLAEMSPTSSSIRREPLRRLRRAHTSPDEPASASARRYGFPRGQSMSPSPSPTPSPAKKARGTGAAAAAGVVERTAFTELMMAGVTAQRDKDKAKAKKRSEFVEDQAVESDEDDMLGFGGVRKKKGDGDEDDDDDDEHDAEGVVKALVDDAHMDEAALAKAKVLERHLEHQTEDDARLEKEVQDVVAGKRRTRRRGGAGGLLGSDGSDEDDDDDEEARALRQRLAKKRRVAGDTLDALARDPATASFHATYQMALVDDADEFAHLDRDQQEEHLGEQQQDDERGEEEGDGDGDGVWEGQDRDRDRGQSEGQDDGEERRGGGELDVADEDVEMAEPSRARAAGAGDKDISAAEVRKALQEVARGEREYRALDPQDVSWMDQDQDDADEEAETLHTRVRVLTASSTSSFKAPAQAQQQHMLPPPPADADMDVISLNRRLHADEQHDVTYAQRMKRWASEEGGSGSNSGGRHRHHHRRMTGTGAAAAAAGAAVTGHHRPPRTAKSSTATAAAAAAAAGGGVAKAKKAPGVGNAGPVRKTASALSAVAADRRGRFGA